MAIFDFANVFRNFSLRFEPQKLFERRGKEITVQFMLFLSNKKVLHIRFVQYKCKKYRQSILRYFWSELNASKIETTHKIEMQLQ